MRYTLLFALLLPACGGGGSTPPPVAIPQQAPDFALRDVNPDSASFDAIVSPRDQIGRTSAWYFGSATWGYCRIQFGFLDQMQAELEAANPGTAIRITGVNNIGSESGNAAMCAGRVLPWLQDTPVELVWTEWAITYRDVLILDADNREVGVYNLTVHDLSDPANYAELKALLLALAGE